MTTAHRSTLGRRRAPRAQVGALGTSVASIGSGLAIVVTNLITGIVTARLLGPTGRGVVITATVWTSMMSWTFMLGLRQSTQYHLARSEPEDRPSWIGSVLTMTVITGVVGALVPQLFVALIVHDHDLLLPVRWFLLATTFFTAFEAVTGLVSGCGRVVTGTVLRAAQPLLYLVGLLIFDAVGDLSSTEALIALGGSFGISSLFGVASLSTTEKFGAPRQVRFRHLIRYGVRIYPGTLSALTNARLDLLILPAFLGAQQVGFYGVAGNLSNSLQLVLGNLALFLFPTMVKRNPEQRAALLGRAVRLTLVLGLSAACVGSLLAGPAIHVLYGDAFTSSAPILRILLFAVVVLATLSTVTAGLSASGRPLRASLANIIGIPITVVGLMVLVPLQGPIGAAWTSLAAYSTSLMAAALLAPAEVFAVRRVVLSSAWLSDFRVLTQLRRGRAHAEGASPADADAA